MKLLVCTYGENKGIYQYNYNQTLSLEKYLPIHGKCNLVIEVDQTWIVSVKGNPNTIEIYDSNTLELLKLYPCEYFYSYGNVRNNKIYLASYENGVDSVFDLEKECFISHNVHKKEGLKAKSHYIHCFNDKIIGIENGLQQFIIYKNDDLEIERMIEYPPINIRLLSLHPNGKYMYMNTEYSNEVIVLDSKDFHMIEKVQMVDHEGWYSGGNAITSDGKYLCVSLRGEDVIYVYDVSKELTFIRKFKCGKNPRDLKFINHHLFVTCSDENTLEVYDIDHDILLCKEEIIQPITFSLR